ncbi:MAG: hypothetical protein JWM16_2722 [Verrucomicrobiales bacterium]|nr:hypothetical protein [Verrucomicrobiales bacterium]
MKPRISRLFYVMFLVALFALSLLFLAMNKRKAEFELTQCTNQMAVVATAAVKWKSVHNGVYPADLSFVRDYGEPRLLVCPSDKSNLLLQLVDWPKTNITALSTYELASSVGPNSGSASNTALFRCRIHLMTVYADGHSSRGIVERR